MPEPGVLFISHAAVDKAVAARFKAELLAAFSNIDIFISSDPGALPPRSAWVLTILDYLKRSDLIIVLATNRGLKRLWVWFEAGTGWESEKSRFLTCCLGVEKHSLPAPFALYQALDLGNAGDLQTLFETELSNSFGPIQSVPDYTLLVSDFKKLDEQAAEQHRLEEDNLYAERVAAVRQVLENLAPEFRREYEGALKMLVVYGTITDYFALADLKGRGLAQNFGGLMSGIQVKTNLVQRSPGQSDRIYQDQISWELRPEMKDAVAAYFYQSSPSQ